MHPILKELPTLHRIHFGNVTGDATPEADRRAPCAGATVPRSRTTWTSRCGCWRSRFRRTPWRGRGSRWC
jgi:hypothetical protein